MSQPLVQAYTTFLNEAWVNKYPDIKDNIGAEAPKYINIANNFPVLPYIRFAVNVRLF